MYVVVPDMSWNDMFVLEWADDLPVPRVIGHPFIPITEQLIAETGPEGVYVRRRRSDEHPVIVSSMTTIAAQNIRLVPHAVTNR